jgi:putative addiction module component (TIGR02574 family)
MQFEFFVSTEEIMAANLEELESQALQLSPPERSKLIHRLIVSLEGEPEGSPEAIAKAWDEEIARRVADMEAGRTQWIPAEEVFKKIDAIISAHRK